MPGDPTVNLARDISRIRQDVVTVVTLPNELTSPNRKAAAACLFRSCPLQIIGVVYEDRLKRGKGGNASPLGAWLMSCRGVAHPRWINTPVPLPKPGRQFP